LNSEYDIGLTDHIYSKWLKTVKPTINIDWNKAKANKIIDGDFYLADILSIDNHSIKEKLYVLLQKDHYELDRAIDTSGLFNSKTAHFTDNQKAHTLFWNRYERPPKEEYWEYIVERRDLLVPQDVRERKGSFFTPQIWVELSQKYLADTFGENWQDEYYIWDCAAGTGNLLNGLTNKYNIWASTLDRQDVDVMKDRIKNGANLLESHVFEFDFLNDDFSKLPIELQKIINDEQKRKKLIIYINPPYAEAGSARQMTKTGGSKSGVSTIHSVNSYFKPKISNAVNELFVLFMAQVYERIPTSKLAIFSKLKFINGSNFKKFRDFFQAKYLGGFIVPANTFDNVKGSFPIGFTIWDTNIKDNIKTTQCDVYEKKGYFAGEKNFYGSIDQNINKWVRADVQGKINLGTLVGDAADFQHNKAVCLQNTKGTSHLMYLDMYDSNLIQMSIYFTVRHAIEATWINDRDQFLYPNDLWQEDSEFQNDCVVYALFHSQNRISSKDGVNHWIPFTEQEVNAKEKFESNFMSDFLGGKYKPTTQRDLFDTTHQENDKFAMSNEAKEVYDAGLGLWRYYHSKDITNINASLYDIREYFQGRNARGSMNTKSEDEQYNELISLLRQSLKVLAKKIELNIYKYGFLLR
jgi:hypothetical protein